MAREHRSTGRKVAWVGPGWGRWNIRICQLATSICQRGVALGEIGTFVGISLYLAMSIGPLVVLSLPLGVPTCALAAYICPRLCTRGVLPHLEKSTNSPPPHCRDLPVAIAGLQLA